MKSAYTRPRLVVYGKLKDITQANGAGDYTDADFPAKTKVSDLTFS
jgi:hypothetical protein